METLAFSQLKTEFESADTEKKIQLYVNTDGLTTEQYKELLRVFPIDQINQLEQALK